MKMRYIAVLLVVFMLSKGIAQQRINLPYDISTVLSNEIDPQRAFRQAYIISLERELSRVQPTGLREVGNDITYIPIETHRNALLRIHTTNLILFSSQHIAIYDGIGVYLFDLSGKFVTRIGRQGRGPGEFIILSSISFSHDSNSLLLLEPSSYGGKILEYSIKGEFLRTITIDSINSGRIRAFDDKNYIFNPENDCNRHAQFQQSLVIADLQGNVVKKYRNHNKMVHCGMSFRYRDTRLYSFQQNIRFMESGSDTIQTVTLNGLSTYAVFDLGRKRMPINDLHFPFPGGPGFQQWLDQYLGQINQNGNYFPVAIFEDVDNIYFRLSDLRSYTWGYFSKRSGAAKLIGEQGFQNDNDGGLPFFPRYALDDGTLVDLIDPFELREHVFSRNAAQMRRLYGQKWDDLVRLANSLDDESNPVLVLVRK